MLKTATLAPIPSASVITATVVKPGFFSNWRKANLRSFITQRLHRIDPGRTTSWQPAGEQCYDCKQQRDRNKRHGISGANAKEQAAHESSQCESPGQSQTNTRTGECHPPPQNHSHHGAATRTQRDA